MTSWTVIENVSGQWFQIKHRNFTYSLAFVKVICIICRHCGMINKECPFICIIYRQCDRIDRQETSPLICIICRHYGMINKEHPFFDIICRHCGTNWQARNTRLLDKNLLRISFDNYLWKTVKTVNVCKMQALPTTKRHTWILFFNLSQ